MSNKAVTDIQQIVNPAKFQKIQDDISAATGLAIITVDYRGVPVTAHSRCCDFCKVMRSSDIYRHLCEKCDSRGGLEAARIRKPFIYFCHAGLVDLAIPIIVDNLYIGAFMAGQVLLEAKDDSDRLEHILTGTGEAVDLSKDQTLSAYYAKLPVMSFEKIEAFSKMLHHIGNYCVEEAVLRASITELSAKKKTVDSHGITERGLTGEGIRKNPFVEDWGKEENHVLKTAVEYIKQHPGERITLAKMASLCNVSESYFSKLFAKENLGNLSNYVNHVKVTYAKELLEKTDWPIRSVADNLGFDDCSYFIKVFKKNEGMTPDEYRKKF